MEEASRAFELCDTDGSGTLSTEEFRVALDRLGLGLTERQVGEVMRAVDTDASGTIEYAEFYAQLRAAAHHEEHEDLEDPEPEERSVWKERLTTNASLGKTGKPSLSSLASSPELLTA